MGLDMYLDRHHHYGGSYKQDDHENKFFAHTLNIGGDFCKNNNIDKSNVSEIIVRQGYWRKANAIHGWFVKNVQNGVDDCARYLVTNEELDTLRETCHAVLRCLDAKEYDKVEHLLPPSEGFFFGQYDVQHEWYRLEIQETIDQLKDIADEGDYYYSSSW